MNGQYDMHEQFKPIPGGRSLLKVVLQALLVLAAAVGLAQAILLPIIQKPLLKSVQTWEVEYLNGGTIDLLAAELNTTSLGERSDLLNELSGNFGFEVSLRHVDEMELDSTEMARLRNSEVVGDPATYTAYKLLADGNWIVVFGKTKMAADHLMTEAQRRSMGTIAMLERILERTPTRDWTGAIDDASNDFGYPVRVLAISDLDLTSEQSVSLQEGRIVTIATEDSTTADYPAEFAYKKVGNSALMLGPFSPPTLSRYYPVLTVYYGLLGLLVVVPLGLWLAPTWRSMNRLSKATAAFGQGDFAARAAPLRFSKTNHLIDVFNQMAGRIQSLVESNKALINAVSHELRTPISRIEFNIELARKSSDISERNRQLDRIEDSMDDLKTMVSEMLQYARFDREKPNFTMESVDIGAWLVSQRESWQESSEEQNIEINVPETQLRAFLESYYMSRAISNLVRNAMSFAKSTIQVSVQSKDGFCEISVSDDGPGIDYQERTRIFEPFVRGDPSRNRKNGGSGLGLAIVKQIVAWHSGDVWVEDSPLGGSKFVVKWPMTRET